MLHLRKWRAVVVRFYANLTGAGLSRTKATGKSTMQRPQFGQRGATINGQPVDVAASVTRTLSRPTAQHGGERVNLLAIVGIVCGALLFLGWFEALLSGTSLITPISQTLLWTMRGIGLVVGLVVTVVVVFGVADGSLLRRGATLLILPILFAFGIGELAYRISDWTEFGFSSQAFEQAQYPIESIDWGRKGARDTIRIDPFKTGDNTEIPINSQQYHALRDSGDYGCVTVMQRKSKSGAVEIATNGRFMWSKPEQVAVARCGYGGAVATPAPTSSDNPWSKD